MSAKLFVGNLSQKTTREQLTRFFSSSGLAASVRLPLDRETGRPRGFAFVEFPNEEQAEQALKVFDGRELGGSRLRVSMARPENENRREHRGPRDTTGAPRRPEREIDSGVSDLGDWRSMPDDDPYDDENGRRRRRRGKHGSDRRRRSGTRRYLD